MTTPSAGSSIASRERWQRTRLALRARSFRCCLPVVGPVGACGKVRGWVGVRSHHGATCDKLRGRSNRLRTRSARPAGADDKCKRSARLGQQEVTRHDGTPAASSRSGHDPDAGGRTARPDRTCPHPASLGRRRLRPAAPSLLPAGSALAARVSPAKLGAPSPAVAREPL
jgi:hypothetical protein